MTRNPFIRAAIEFAEVEIKKTAGVNSYDPETNTIHMNLLSNTRLGQRIRKIFGRPGGSEYSLAHECAHAVFDVCEFWNVKEFTRTFGYRFRDDGKEVREMFLNRNNEPGPEYISTYAEYDSEEDFAECFAFMATHRNKIPVRIQNKKLLAKLKYVQEILSEIREEAC